MLRSLQPAHRLARVNYPPRVLALAYSLLVLGGLMIERGIQGWVLFFGVLQFLVYPHIAYLYARIAVDSKRAELNNLLADAVMLGAWAAQTHFAFWPTCGFLGATCLNNAANGGPKRFAYGVASFGVGAAAWGAVLGYPFEPETGPLVSVLSFAGIVGYSSWIGIILYQQNRRILGAREALRSSEEQFRFIAEHAGDFVAVLDADGRFRYASASHLEHYPVESVIEGADWLALVHPDDRGPARNFLQYMMRSRLSDRAEIRMVAAKGPSRVLECEGNPVWDPRGDAQMVILVCRDITAGRA